MNNEFTWNLPPPEPEEVVKPFEFSHSKFHPPTAFEENKHEYIFKEGQKIEIDKTLEFETNKAQEKIEIKGLDERFKQFKDQIFTKENVKKISYEFTRALYDVTPNEEITEEQIHFPEKLQPGQNIADFLESQIDSNNQKIEKSTFRNAFRSFTKNAPARIILGASLGALGGPIGMLGKLALSAAGGAFLGEGIAEKKAESKALVAFSNVEGLLDSRTGEYDEIKLQEVLSQLDKTELAKIVGGLSEVASVKGLTIAKNIAELSVSIEKNKNSPLSRLQEKFSLLPKGRQKLLKCLPILGGAALLATPFVLPIAGLGIAGLAASGALLSLVSSGIDRVSTGPKSIGKYYNHSRVVIKSIEELERKMSNEKFDNLQNLLINSRDSSNQIPLEEANNLFIQQDSDRVDVVINYSEARKEVKKSLAKGAAFGVLGMEALQYVAPLVEHKAASFGHGMSVVFGRFSSLFAHGGLSSEPAAPHLNHISIAQPKQFVESGLHLTTLDNGRILHWEGAATTEHPVSAVNSLSHEVIYSVEPTLDKHDQNEAAHKLAQDWIHRGLFHADGSLVQDGKELLTTKINAYDEAVAALRGIITT